MSPEAGPRAYDPCLRRWIAGRGGGAAAVLPVGSLEQHGAHLPVSTDSEIAAEVSRRVCRRNGFLLLPAVPYGVSFEHAPLFNVSLGASTLRRVALDAAASLASNGIGALFVVNGHHGNRGALAGLDGRARKGAARVLALSYWRYMDGPFDHAGLAETSLMLAAGGAARMSRARKGFAEPPGLGPAQRAALARKAAASFTSVAENGVWGDPRGATARRGERLLRGAAGRIGERCRACLAEWGRAAARQ